MRISMPFTIKELEASSFHPIVEGEIDGKSITLILDTGASRTVISKKLTTDYPVISIENEEPFAAGINAETMAIEQINIPLINIGGVSFSNMIVFSTNLDAISNLYEKIAGMKIDGLLGCDFLLEHEAKVDFEQRTISINKLKS
jgi:predicted aspartyl protease